MENGSSSSGVNKRKITAEEVLTKLKDDGDFDKLRLKVIRQLKHDGELRSNIISKVKKSAALNRPGAENMKPRQLSDAIHQEIGNEVMSQISDSVWKVIRSGDGMKAEIVETVQSVYSKLLNPRVNEYGESSSHTSLLPVQKEYENNRSLAASANQVEERLYEREPNEPPGFSMQDHSQNNTNGEHDLPKKSQKKSKSSVDETREEHIQETHHIGDRSEPSRASKSSPPGTSKAVEQKQSDDGSDDDPDLPPGFS